MDNEAIEEAIHNSNYLASRCTESGIWLAVAKFIYTYGLLVKVDEYGYSGRYCYEKSTDALVAMASWDCTGHPPGPWIKYKGQDGEMLGPGATE